MALMAEAVYGACTPPGWTLEGAREMPHDQTAAELPQSRINLLDDVMSHVDWPLGDQAGRGTCNAFAVVAAEELYRMRQSKAQTMQLFSQEHFYSAIRQCTFEKIGMQVTDDVKRAQHTQGLTFLAQAKQALIDFGLCQDTLMPTLETDDPAFFVQEIPDAVAKDAASRWLDADALEHNIIDVRTGAAPPQNLTWVTALRSNIVTLFKDKLAHGIPVVASFAILDKGSWFSNTAEQWGKVRYCLKEDLQVTGRPDGHTVCIVGYEPPADGDTQSGGWFHFRNSYGDGFARYFDDNPFEPGALGKGYGYISAKDVNVYCWEYLFRK